MKKIYMDKGLVLAVIRIEHGVDARASKDFLPAFLIVRLRRNQYRGSFLIDFSFGLVKFKLRTKGEVLSCRPLLILNRH